MIHPLYEHRNPCIKMFLQLHMRLITCAVIETTTLLLSVASQLFTFGLITSLFGASADHAIAWIR